MIVGITAIMPASSIAGGMCMAFPDTCNTPAPPSPSPVPIPYPNIAQVNLAQQGSKNVLIEMMDTVLENSEISASSGDEAGVSTGLSSGTIMGKVVFKMASNTVMAEGKKIVMMTSMSAHNGSSANAPAVLYTPSQMKVFIGV